MLTNLLPSLLKATDPDSSHSNQDSPRPDQSLMTLTTPYEFRIAGELIETLASCLSDVCRELRAQLFGSGSGVPFLALSERNRSLLHPLFQATDLSSLPSDQHTNGVLQCR